MQGDTGVAALVDGGRRVCFCSPEVGVGVYNGCCSKEQAFPVEGWVPKGVMYGEMNVEESGHLESRGFCS